REARAPDELPQGITEVLYQRLHRPSASMHSMMPRGFRVREAPSLYNAFSFMMPTPSRQVFLAVFAVAAIARGAEPSKGAALVAERCLKCHNASVPMSGLSLASAADAGKGGLHGPAIVPGKPDESVMMAMISGEKPKMPLNAPPLSATQVGEIRSWIERGAPWPEELRANRKPADRKDELWSLKPLQKSSVPQLDWRWVRTPIDASI